MSLYASTADLTSSLCVISVNCSWENHEMSCHTNFFQTTVLCYSLVRAPDYCPPVVIILKSLQIFHKREPLVCIGGVRRSGIRGGVQRKELKSWGTATMSKISAAYSASFFYHQLPQLLISGLLHEPVHVHARRRSSLWVGIKLTSLSLFDQPVTRVVYTMMARTCSTLLAGGPYDDGTGGVDCEKLLALCTAGGTSRSGSVWPCPYRLGEACLLLINKDLISIWGTHWWQQAQPWASVSCNQEQCVSVGGCSENLSIVRWITKKWNFQN